MKNPGKVGIYCLANDKVLEWMVAFLESVRSHEPDLPIYIVPFDDNISKLTQIASQYNFEFYRDKTLETLDKIGEKVRGIEDIQNHRFRIFSIFWGPLDNFIFLDSDIVVLDSLQELFQTYLDSDFEFMYYYRGIFDQVYKSGEFRSQMIREYNANGFNAGSFLSSKGVFSLEDIDKIADRAATIRQHFADKCIVQPFVNYCVDIQRLKTEAIADAIPDIGSEWAKFPIEKVGETYQVNGKRIFYTHWAGFGYGPSMPNRDLFLQYRLKSQSWFSRYRYIIGERFRVLVQTWRNTVSKTVKSFLNPSKLNRV